MCRMASSTVSVIATATNTVVKTIAVGNCPLGGRRHPRRDTRLCHECSGNSIAVIATVTNTVVKTIDLGG